MGLEIERKYLIKKPDVQKLKEIPGCVVEHIKQTYLKSKSGTERRVRCIATKGVFSYTYTEKTKISDMTREENENNISAEEYISFLNESDPLYSTIEKERFSFPYEGKIIEIDIYKNFENYSCLFYNNAIMEIELSNESEVPVYPSFIKEGIEITGVKEYSNRNISKYLADAKKTPYLETYFNYRIKPVGFSYPLTKNGVHIHDKDSLKNKGFLEIYNEYGLKTHNHYHMEISLRDKRHIASEFFDDKRTLFQREEERIISTEAFRRLQYKTQVMVNSVSDDQRTRLLHSLEVEKISRKIATALGANCQLAETIAIGHDIGHTPFGHAGEYAIRDYLEANFAGSFSHAIQGVKVLDFLCSHRTLKPLGIRGLGISKHVLEGVLKHDTDSFSEDISNAAYKLQYDCSDLFIPVGFENRDKFKGVLLGGIESQIVCWADKIAYMSHDWEEFVSIGYLEKMLNRVNMIVIQMCQIISAQKYCEVFPATIDTEDERKSIKCIVENIKTLNTILNSRENYSKNKLTKSINNIIYETKKRIDINSSIKINDKDFKYNDNLLFSSEQYQTLYSFFNIANAWIVITDEFPEGIGTKMDAIFIIYNYLCKLLPHTTTPALIDKLILESKKKINGFNRNEFINESNEKLRTQIIINTDESNPKDCIKKAFLVNFEEKVFDAVKDVTEFIKVEYNRSTRIENMNHTAKQIIDSLYEFYSKHPHMLPLKQRNRIKQEITVACTDIENCLMKKLLIEYYYLKIIEAEDEVALSDSLSKNLLHKVSNGFITTDRETVRNQLHKGYEIFKNSFIVKPQEIKRVITLRVITDYIAGMTDRMAEMKYNEIISSSAQWSQEYTERATFSVY